MAKKLYLFVSAFALALALIAGCKSPAVNPGPDDKEGETQEPAPLELTLVINDDWVWEGKPELTIHAENPNKENITAEAKAVITTDKKAAVTTLTRSVELPGESEQDIALTTTEDLPAGFYRATCTVNDQWVTLQLKNGKISSFVFGI
ncbi:MAG: hypothetical protein J6Y45_00130, partial [Bacteroidales bacterium]|nr:hypothetical protein [Bacteroidales bacterium]